MKTEHRISSGGKITGEAGGLHWLYKGLIQPRLKTHEQFANRKLFTDGSVAECSFQTQAGINALNKLARTAALTVLANFFFDLFVKTLFCKRPFVLCCSAIISDISPAPSLKLLCQGLELPDAVGVPGEQFLLLLCHGGQKLFLVAGNQMQQFLVFRTGRKGVFAGFL